MASVFAQLTDIPSFHEPAPYCLGETMKDVNENWPDISDKTRRILDEKIKRIQEDSVNGNYLETNNMFIKSFVWAVMEAFEDVYCIYLHRDPLETFLSHADRNWKFGQDWLLKAEWKMNILKQEPGLTYHQDMLFNWYEIRKRFYYWKPLFVKTWDFDFRNIKNLEEYHRLFEHLGIKYDKNATLPESGRNENMPERPISERMIEVFSFVLASQDRKGTEWAFSSDEEILESGMHHKRIIKK